MPRIWRSRANRWLAPLLAAGLLLPLWATGAGERADAQDESTTTSTTQEPTPPPTPDPTEEPTPDPTEEPTPDPTEEPTPDPTEEPTPEEPDCEADPGAEGCEPDCEADPGAEGCEPDCEADPGAEGCEPDCEADPGAEGCEPDEEPTEEPEDGPPESRSVDEIESGSEIDLPPAGRAPDTGYVVINGILRSPGAVSDLLTRLGDAATMEADALERLRAAVEEDGVETDRSTESLSELEGELEDLQDRLAELEALLAALTDAYDELERQLEGNEENLVHQAIEAYVSGSSRASAPGMLLTVEDPVMGSVLEEYVEAATTPNSRSDFEDSDVRGTLEVLHMTIDPLAEQVDAAADEEKAASQAVKTLRESLEARLDNLDEGVRTVVDEVVALRTQKNALAIELGSTDPDPVDILSIVAAAFEEHEGGDQTLGLPLFGAPTMASGFGLRFHPIFEEVRLHTGADLSAPYGAPIFAAASGRVVLAASQIGYGLVVIVEHEGGISTLYSHMSGFAVGLGERVDKGEVIGFVGSTGYSTGPHLHYEVRVLGNPVDPIPYIRAAQGG